ncbi:uncharacterized protein LOC124910525 [Impatiens glandulifera]|uniref:uncharacterized protein LOC124910525 n=1 Tax=Impatiens glandulifera TaxID=253017 RepID=UPI001FB18EE3|nr:uncharacterized protein LOC124910525 [Impatiens glandulifera]
MREDRKWMDYRTLPDRQGWNEDFFEGVEDFLKFATSKAAYMNGDKIRCPCSKCVNMKCKDLDDCRNHLYEFGFTENYYTWIFHGEPHQQIHPSPNEVAIVKDEELNACHPSSTSQIDNADSENAEKDSSSNFLKVLQASYQPLWKGHPHHTQLSTTLKLVNFKFEHNLSETVMGSLLDLVCELLPADNNLPRNSFEANKLLTDLGLPIEDRDDKDDSENDTYDDEDCSENDTNDDEDCSESDTDDNDDDGYAF